MAMKKEYRVFRLDNLTFQIKPTIYVADKAKHCENRIELLVIAEPDTTFYVIPQYTKA